MVSIITFGAYFVLTLFQTGCPGWGDGILLTTTGCPDLYKEQKTFVSFYDPPEAEPRSNGRGQCGGGLQCWPGFRQPVYEDTGEDATYYYRQWVAKVDEKAVVFPDPFEPAVCDIYNTLTFREPLTYSGKCLKPTPTNQDDCESVNWYWNPFSDSCQEEAPPECNLLPEICENGIWSFQWCGCVPYNTPIVLDLNGNGFDLTNADHGVPFNLNNIGEKEKLAWTSVSSDEAWLVLDRNGNGTIDDGAELFGDITEQPEPPAGEKKNGFRALAEYDRVSNGGNANGQIESGDSVFPSLRLWQDANHDGLSEPSELHSCTAARLAF